MPVVELSQTAADKAKQLLEQCIFNQEETDFGQIEETLSCIVKNNQEIIKAIPLGKLGSCSQVANLVSFLVSSNAGSYITGQTISIDGGMSI